MKPIKLLSYSVLSAFLYLSCNETDSSASTDTKASADLLLTPVYVESGTIDSVTFVSNGAFSASDNAIGRIDTCKDMAFNGYKSSEGWVYVFANKELPKEFIGLSPTKLSEAFTNGKWADDIKYELKYDAEICKQRDEQLYYYREAGVYLRQKATILTADVYRFKDNYVVEDYSKALDYHEYLRPSKLSNPSLFDLVGVSSSEYVASIISKDNTMEIDEKGMIIYTSGKYTPKGSSDKIYIKPKNEGLPTYRFRHFYYKIDDSTIFDSDGRVKETYRGVWSNEDSKEKSAFGRYLVVKINEYLKEPIINGYACSKCGSQHNSQTMKLKMAFEADGPPPLPLIANGQ